MSILQRLLGSIKRLLGAPNPRAADTRSPARRKYSGPRVITFVDGANLDVALRKLDNKALRWCDLKKLSIELIDRQDFLREVRFYAAPPKYLPPDVMEHYKKYVHALRNKNVVVIEGNYKSRERKVTIGQQVSVGRQADTGEFTEDQALTQQLRDTNSAESNANLMFRYTSHEEKETDVNIALDMLDFAHKGKYDKCILISGDTDFNPVVDRVLELAPHLSVMVVTPPDQRRNIRDSRQARQGRRKRMELSTAMLERSLLPTSARNGRGGGGGGSRSGGQRGGGGGGGQQRRRGGGGGGQRGGGGGGGRQQIGSSGRSSQPNS